MSSTIDIIKIAYKVLFSLQVEFEGGDLAGSNITILPDPKTIDLYLKYRILGKKQKATTVVLIETLTDGVDKGKPEVPLQSNELFRFQIKLSRSFLGETHLASYNFTENVLYASNTANNVLNTDLLLSLPPPLYSAANAYEKGYLVQSGSKCYKAIQPSDAGNQHGVTETDFWKEIDAGFISQADLRTRASLTQPADLDTMIVVEVVHNAALSADYKLLDASLKCREVIYKIKLHTSR
jgi:hypothetical protein